MGQIFTRKERAHFYEYTKWRKVLQNKKNISEKSFSAAIQIVEFLKANFREEGIFLFPGRADMRSKIFSCIMKGDVVTLKTFLRSQTVIESASALQTFIRDMKQPIIPMRVQKLVLADNPGIPENVVASDAFGLLQQELTGKRLELLLSVLELIYLICSNSIRTELTCVSLPITILPTFFDTKLLWSQKWQKAATRFHEIIIKTPELMGRMNRSMAPPDPLARYRSYIRLIRHRILANHNNYY